MKKDDQHLLQRLFTSILLLYVQQSIHAQVPEPATWDTFINSPKNVSIRDTFRMQTFEGRAEDNWRYTTHSETTLFEAYTEGLNSPQGKHSLKLLPASSLTFESFDNTFHRTIFIKVSLAGQALTKGETLTVDVERVVQPNTWIWATALTDDWGIAYQTPTKTYVNPFQIGSNPRNIKLTVSKQQSTASGFFCTDSVYAFGDIPQYSLFSGIGAWSDTTRWSKLPAARHRSALINGQVTVDADSQCHDLYLGNGTLSVAPHATLSIQGAASVYRTFDEVGKWYFISFPFDVYADGIDAGFRLQDETYRGSGNVFYVKTYNGNKRATTQTNQGNWETLPATAPNALQPIFRKHQGYLIALDAAASRQTLCFSSKGADLPTDFGQSSPIPVQASQSHSSEANEHSGWHLCGNPLASALSLSQIEPNPALDGNIYLYNGSTYAAYAIGSDYALPAFAAFFVKASSDTELRIHSAPPADNQPLLSEALRPLAQAGAEPSMDVRTHQQPLLARQSQIVGDELQLRHLPAPAQIRIIGLDGQILYTSPVAPGSSCLSLSFLTEGIYLLDTTAGSRHFRQKFILRR